MLHFSYQRLLHLRAASRAEAMAAPKPCTALRARKAQAALKVLDCDHSLHKVYVLYLHSQNLTNAAAQLEKNVNQQPVPKVVSCLLHQVNFFRLKVNLHDLSVAILSVTRVPSETNYHFKFGNHPQ